MTGRPALLALVAAAAPACLDAPPSTTEPDGGTGGLLAAFRFEENGFLVDWSGNGHDGICSGLECPMAVDGRPGRGQAAVFDGIDDLISIESVGSGPFTVMAWMRVDQSLGGATACPLNKPYGVEMNNTWQLCVRTSAGTAQVFFYASEVPHEMWMEVPMEIGIWNHVALRWDGGKKTIFWNGGDVASQDGSTQFDESAIRLGSDIDGADPVDPFPGALDDLEIYDRALADEEILVGAGL